MYCRRPRGFAAGCPSGERFGQHFGHVTQPDGCEMSNLLAATGAGGHDGGSKWLVHDLLNQWFRDLDRKFVFRFEHPESPAMPQQPESSKVTVFSGSRSASCRMRLGLKDRLFSRQGALTTALNWGTGLFAAGLFMVCLLALVGKTHKAGLPRRIGVVALASIILVGLVYLSLPKIEVKLVKTIPTIDMKMEQIGSRDNSGGWRLAHTCRGPRCPSGGNLQSNQSCCGPNRLDQLFGRRANSRRRFAGKLSAARNQQSVGIRRLLSRRCGSDLSDLGFEGAALNLGAFPNNLDRGPFCWHQVCL